MAGWEPTQVLPVRLPPIKTRIANSDSLYDDCTLPASNASTGVARAIPLSATLDTPSLSDPLLSSFDCDTSVFPAARGQSCHNFMGNTTPLGEYLDAENCSEMEEMLNILLEPSGTPSCQPLSPLGSSPRPSMAHMQQQLQLQPPPTASTISQLPLQQHATPTLLPDLPPVALHAHPQPLHHSSPSAPSATAAPVQLVVRRKTSRTQSGPVSAPLLGHPLDLPPLSLSPSYKTPAAKATSATWAPPAPYVSDINHCDIPVSLSALNLSDSLTSAGQEPVPAPAPGVAAPPIPPLDDDELTQVLEELELMLPGFSTASGAEAAAAAAAVAAAMLPESPSASSGQLADLTSLFLLDNPHALMMPDSSSLLDFDLSSDSEWQPYSTTSHNKSLLHSMHPAPNFPSGHLYQQHSTGRNSHARSAAGPFGSRSSSNAQHKASGRSKASGGGGGGSTRAPRRWGQGQLHPQQAQVDALITEQLLRSTQCAAAGDYPGQSLLPSAQLQPQAPDSQQPACSGSDKEEGTQLGRVAAAAAAAAVSGLPPVCGMMSDDNSSEHLHPTSRGSKRSSDDGTSSDASKPGAKRIRSGRHSFESSHSQPLTGITSPDATITDAMDGAQGSDSQDSGPCAPNKANRAVRLGSSRRQSAGPKPKPPPPPTRCPPQPCGILGGIVREARECLGRPQLVVPRVTSLTSPSGVPAPRPTSGPPQPPPAASSARNQFPSNGYEPGALLSIINTFKAASASAAAASATAAPGTAAAVPLIAGAPAAGAPPPVPAVTHIPPPAYGTAAVPPSCAPAHGVPQPGSLTQEQVRLMLASPAGAAMLQKLAQSRPAPAAAAPLTKGGNASGPQATGPAPTAPKRAGGPVRRVAGTQHPILQPIRTGFE